MLCLPSSIHCYILNHLFLASLLPFFSSVYFTVGTNMVQKNTFDILLYHFQTCFSAIMSLLYISLDFSTNPNSCLSFCTLISILFNSVAFFSPILSYNSVWYSAVDSDSLLYSPVTLYNLAYTYMYLVYSFLPSIFVFYTFCT